MKGIRVPRFYFTAERALLLLILVTAAVLRFANAANFSLTHDELSALGRLRFDSFNELIRGGVLTDTHPPGIQVFLWYWTRWFGLSDFMVRLPFLLMGLGSVWLIYGIGKRLYGASSGLWAAAFWACAEYAVYYSQLSRPYIPGTFAVLGLVYVMTRWNGRFPGSLYAALWGTAAVYVHHFALLQVGLLGLAGFWLFKGNGLKWLAVCLSWFLLYLPNLPVFFDQLSRGGVGEWLGTPEVSFFGNFFSYLFHFSGWWMAALALSLLIGLSAATLRNTRRWSWVLLMCGVLPALIGWTYSQWVAPVLQYSVLIFSVPLLTVLAGGLFRTLLPWKLWGGVLLVLLPGIWTLVRERLYYPLMDDQSYKAYVEMAEPHRHGHTQYLFGDGDYQIFHYQKQLDNPFPFCYNFPPEGQEFRDLHAYFSGLDTDEVLLGDLPAETALLASFFYPALLEHRMGFGYDHYRLGRSGAATLWTHERNFPAEGVISLGKENEVGPKIEAVLSDLIHHRHTPLVAWAFGSGEAELAMALYRGDEQVDFRSVPSKRFELGSGEFLMLLTLSPALFIPPGGDLSAYRLEVYVLKSPLGSGVIREGGIKVLPANPQVWGLLEPLR